MRPAPRRRRSAPVPNLAQDRPCHEQGRPARVYVIIRDGTINGIRASCSRVSASSSPTCRCNPTG
ncbi:MAG: hypothetical protein ACK56I_27045 [bacterium]